MSPLRIGVDLGGTKIEAVALLEDGAECPRVRVHTPQGEYGATIAAIVEAVRAAMRAAASSGRAIGRSTGNLVQADRRGEGEFSGVRIGVGHPGSVSAVTGLHRNANSTCLNGQDLRGDLMRAFGQPVKMANDANCFALSEAVDGAGRDARVVFGVIIGTGVGGGVVVDRRVLEGANGIAGEWGHMPQPGIPAQLIERTPCYCGGFGCVEMFCSGGAIVQDLSREAASAALGITSLEDLACRSVAGDSNCQAALDRFQNRFAAALAVVAQLIDPDAIVLGGGVSNLPQLYETQFSERVRRRCFGREFKTPIRPALHGDSGGVRGAAALWLPGE